jgi:hypothetical protein
MTKRLQVLLDDEELAAFQRLARRRRMTTAGWVRHALRAAQEAEAGADVGQKLAAVRRATSFAFPTADIETMLDDIEQGYRDPAGS